MTAYYARSGYDLIPPLSGYTYGDFVVSASSERATVYSPVFTWSAWRACNGTVDTSADAWLSVSEVCWLKVGIGTFLGSPYGVTSYAIAAAPEGIGLYYAPRNWILEGSNDNSSWTTIDTQTEQTAWSYKEIRAYTLSTPATYLWYRLSISNNNYGGNITAIGEFVLRGGSIFVPATAAAVSVTAAADVITTIGVDSGNGIYATIRDTIGGIITDKQIAISSYSMRNESGSTQNISVVVPTMADAEAISDLVNGDLYLWAIQNGQLIAMGNAPITAIRMDEGARSQSISISAGT